LFPSQITEFHFCISLWGLHYCVKMSSYLFILERGSVGRSAPKLTVWMDWISNLGRKKSFHLVKRPHWLWGPYGFQLNRYWIYLPGIKRPRHEAGYSQSATDIENTWNCTCTFPLCLSNVHYLFISSSYSTTALSVCPCLPLQLMPIPVYPMLSFSIVSHQTSLNRPPHCLSTWV
jgi:hypothetical protein